MARKGGKGMSARAIKRGRWQNSSISATGTDEIQDVVLRWTPYAGIIRIRFEGMISA